MNKYQIEVEWTGLSSGYSIYIVEAESAIAALDNFSEDDLIEHKIVDNQITPSARSIFVLNSKNT